MAEEISFEAISIEVFKEQSGISTRAFNSLNTNYKLSEIVHLSDEGVLNRVPNVSVDAANLIAEWIKRVRAGFDFEKIPGVTIEEGEFEIRRMVKARKYIAQLTDTEIAEALRPVFEKKIGRSLKGAQLTFTAKGYIDTIDGYEVTAALEITE